MKSKNEFRHLSGGPVVDRPTELVGLMMGSFEFFGSLVFLHMQKKVVKQIAQYCHYPYEPEVRKFLLNM